ncbi:VWA domain-containing protein, partial [bacterium]
MKRLIKFLCISVLVTIILGVSYCFAMETSSSSILEHKDRYSHKNVVDGDMFTAWAEGAKGDGIGEWIMLNFKEKKNLEYIGIIPGYTKYNDKVGEVWFKNNRLKKAIITLSDGSNIPIELVDKQQIQYFKIGKKTSSIKITIDGVYKGLTWPDTCISEIVPIFDFVKDLNTSLQFDLQSLPKNKDSFYGLLELQATYQENSVRSPINLCLVIDRSGSMQVGDKMKFVVEAAKLVLGSLDEKDTVSIVGYDDKIETFLEPTQLFQDEKNKVVKAIEQLTPRGLTNIAGALAKGIEWTIKAKQPEQIIRVILLSDGLANVGVTDPLWISKIAADAYKNHGIVVSTFGVGEEYNEDLLAKIASVSLGKYYYVNNPREMFMNFHSEMTNLSKIVLKDVELSFKKPKNYSIQKIYGYDYSNENGNIVVKLPSIKLGEKRLILVEFNKVNSSKKIEVNGTISFFNDLTKVNDKKNISASIKVTKEDTVVYNKNSYDKILRILAAENLENTIVSYQKG